MNVKEIVERLNLLQCKAFGGLTDEIRSEWKGLCEKLHALGYRARRKGCMWYASSLKRANTRNTECEYIYTDIRPKDGRRTLRGDCTTRAMAFCLEGVMSYREIEAKQYALAASVKAEGYRRARRNTNGIWEKVITELGYVRIGLTFRVKRSLLGRYLAGEIFSPVCAHSKGHVAVIDQNGAVRDTWDSRGGLCDYLLVNGCDLEKVRDVLTSHGVTITISIL